MVSRERGTRHVRGRASHRADVGAGVVYSLFRSVESQGFEQRSEVIDLSETTDEDG